MDKDGLTHMESVDIEPQNTIDRYAHIRKKVIEEDSVSRRRER